MSVHTLSHSAVVHVGNLDHDRAPPTYSQEGDGLSVSTCPEDWASIARLGRHAHALVNHDACFYNASLNGPRDFVIEWCLANDYITETDGYRVYYTDRATGDEVFMETYNRSDAESWLANNEDYPESRLESVRSFRLDDCGQTYWQNAFTSDTSEVSPIDIRGLLPVWYAEHTDDAEYDGVWWEHTHDPANYSAPRGVIFQSKLDDWEEVWSGNLNDLPLCLDELSYAARPDTDPTI